MTKKRQPAPGRIFGNGNLPTGPADIHQRELAIEKKFGEIFTLMGFDWRHDHNMRETPRRAAKMYMQELLAGCFSPPPRLTTFENPTGYSNLVNVGPIAVRSLCAHHLMPITGEAYVSILPNADGRMIGLSKLSRVVRWHASRFQLQEELTTQIANRLEQELQPAGCAVRIIATHHCMAHRGVMEHGANTDTIRLTGLLLTDSSLKQEFYESCRTLMTRAK